MENLTLFDSATNGTIQAPGTHANEEVQPSQIEQWKTELTQRLSEVSQAIEQANQALSVLEPYRLSYQSSISGFEYLPRVVQKWLAEVCEEANASTNNISHINITVENLPRSLTSFDFPCARGFYEADTKLPCGTPFFDGENEPLSEWLIDNFNFNLLEQSVKQAQNEIEKLGFQDAASRLASAFHLINYNNYQNTALKVRMQKGRYLLEMDYHGWAHERTRNYHQIKQAAMTFEREADVCGLSYCLQMMINAEHHLSLDNILPSRTQVAHDGKVSATFFKEKIKLGFEPDVFEALIGFIRAYLPDDINLKTIEV